ncbi:MAG TPA: glycosyltransferase family 4 protein [Hymenobacter sp.]|jgi:glycosyltransferase involved in cell wall biosynthesis
MNEVVEKLGHRPVILIIDNSVAVTGALVAIRNATDQLLKQYEFVYVLPSGSRGKQVLNEAGYRVFELPFVEISRRKTALLRYVPMLLLNGWRLRQLARRERATIIHLNDFYNLTGYVARALSLGRLRVITHVRFLPQVLPQPLARLWRGMAETFAGRVLCVSAAVRTYFNPSAKVQVVFDPLPGGEKSLAAPRSPARSDGTVQLLYLSNYIPGKGQNFALAAFRKAYAHNSRLRLHFVGGDMGLEKNRAFRQQLEAEVRTHHLEEVVSFGGFVADVEQAIKAADILLNFSEAESFSLTCRDALYYGTPLIATDCGGPAELFENGQSGLLVPNRDVQAMAAAIIQLAADAALRARFAAAGREFIRHKLRPEVTYLQLDIIYKETLRS